MATLDKDPDTVLVTGASGFVGRALCSALVERGFRVRCAVRTKISADVFSAACEQFILGDIGLKTVWGDALRDVSAVVHLAARTHVINETAPDAWAAYRQINVEGTDSLVRAAAISSVRRIVFMSSVKVNGERTLRAPFTERDPPEPEDAYGKSKWEAEQSLMAIAKKTGIDFVILRPPLVYGPGVKGNFLRLLKWVARGVPLPLASIKNQRSLIYVGNLVDCIISSIQSAAAANNTYLLRDNEDISTPSLIRAMAAALGVRPKLFSVHPVLLKTSATLAGRGAEMGRLASSLQIDSSKIERELGWVPRYSLAQGLRDTAQWYHSLRQENIS